MDQVKKDWYAELAPEIARSLTQSIAKLEASPTSWCPNLSLQSECLDG